ncbi:MAG: membrane protein insertion efficiency factor YidD [Planctomycetes bacterium]|nr:membrane protein insertion efficiency factor YidD [Planctomycetota bacterium]MCB9891864.1 membrane protein insertion efficiency factor YidD [Planctomycetota bacterium]MCB9918720.1 membrane protein insertion efficiency factor YidD [Planctomycetota bacterium]
MSQLGATFALPVRFYRRFLSPLKKPCCRFHPTCSSYALEALDRHGAIKGSLLSARRILRCHPFGGSGFDPVPPRACRRDDPATKTTRNAVHSEGDAP